jgi:hypothetical protein
MESDGASEPAPIRRPLLATLWIAAVVAAALWPVVSHFLGRHAG